MICQLSLVCLLVINVKLAILTTSVYLDLNITNKLPQEGGKSNDVLKVTKDEGSTWETAEEKDSTRVSPEDKDSAWLTPKYKGSNFEIASWPGKRASRSDATSRNGLKTRSQLIWAKKNFTVYLAVHKKTSPSETR